MTYKGRIVGLILALIHILILLYDEMLHSSTYLELHHAIYLIVYPAAGWWLGRLYDINRMQAKELRKSNERFQTIFEKAGIGIAISNIKGQPETTNPKLQSMLGYTAEELASRTIADISYPEDGTKNLELFQELLEGKRDSYQLEKRYIRKDGNSVWGQVTSTLLPGKDGEEPYVIGMVIDITERKLTEQKLYEANQKLQQLSNRDGLTGIANRRFFEEVYQMEWKYAVENHTPLSVIMIDIDLFKAYNDTYGHQGGDRCLITVATTLQEALQHPAYIIARYGGEEFIVILPETDEEEAGNIAELLLASVRDLRIPNRCSTFSNHVTVSIGVATVIPDNNTHMNQLIHTADGALYEAKQEGRNQIRQRTRFSVAR